MGIWVFIFFLLFEKFPDKKFKKQSFVMVAQPPVEEINPLWSKASPCMLGNRRPPIQGGARHCCKAL